MGGRSGIGDLDFHPGCRAVSLRSCCATCHDVCICTHFRADTRSVLSKCWWPWCPCHTSDLSLWKQRGKEIWLVSGLWFSGTATLPSCSELPKNNLQRGSRVYPPSPLILAYLEFFWLPSKCLLSCPRLLWHLDVVLLWSGPSL